MIDKTQKSFDFVKFEGGLDTVTPNSLLRAGFVSESINVEQDVNGGYQPIKGYTPFDGSASPWNDEFTLLPFTLAGTVVPGITITGATSGATSVIVAVRSDCFVVSQVVGTWVTETTTTHGASIDTSIVPVYPSNKDWVEYRASYAETWMPSYIGAITGADNLLGIWAYKSTVYAFRNKSGSGVGMYKATATGWLSVSLGYEVPFSNANASVKQGDNLFATGVAVIARVVVESGTLLSGTNTGRIIFAAPSSGSILAGAATTSGGGTLTLTANATAITIPNKNGRYEFVNANFTGSASTQRMYGCDGVNRPFEFDGINFVPLQPISATVYPLHIAAHRNHLFFSYKSSLIHSAIGDPYNYTTTAGGGELAVSDDVTGLMVQPGSETTASMAVFCRNSSYMLYGSDAGTWELMPFNDSTGAYPYTIQKIGGQTFFIDDRGLITLNTAKEFGNFLEATVSQRFKTWLDARKHLIVDSHVSRDKQQYRLFCSNGDGAYITITSKGVAMMPVYFQQPVLCSCSYEDSSGQEKIVFGTTDTTVNGTAYNFVYQLDKTTMAGFNSLSWYMNLVFNASNSMRVLKRYRRITLEATGTDYALFRMTYSLSYGNGSSAQPDTVTIESDYKVPYWDAFDWDAFIWDGQALQIHSKAVSGVGENISIQLSGSDNYSSPVKFSGALIEYSPLRTMR